MVEYKTLVLKIGPPRASWNDPPYGEIFRLTMEDGIFSAHYVLCCPVCGGTGFLSKHTVAVDGNNVTLHPSVVCGEKCGAHYFVKDSVIIPC